MTNDARTTRGTGEGASARHTVHFDGSCPLCTFEIGHYRTRQGSEALRFVDVSAEEAETGPDLDRTTAMGRFHVRRPDGALVSGARGFVEIWSVLPGWRWLSRLGRLPGVVSLLEVGYRLFLPIRPVLSRLAFALGARPSSPDTQTIGGQR